MRFLYIYSDPIQQPHPVVVNHSDNDPMSYQNIMQCPNTLECDREMVLILRQLEIGAHCNDNRTRAIWVRVE